MYTRPGGTLELATSIFMVQHASCVAVAGVTAARSTCRERCSCLRRASAARVNSRLRSELLTLTARHAQQTRHRGGEQRLRRSLRLCVAQRQDPRWQPRRAARDVGAPLAAALERQQQLLQPPCRQRGRRRTLLPQRAPGHDLKAEVQLLCRAVVPHGCQRAGQEAADAVELLEREDRGIGGGAYGDVRGQAA